MGKPSKPARRLLPCRLKACRLGVDAGDTRSERSFIFLGFRLLTPRFFLLIALQFTFQLLQLLIFVFRRNLDSLGGPVDGFFEIADFSTMWFQFQAYEIDMPWLKLGQSVTITTPSLPGKSFEGKITFIDPNFDEATRSTKVRVELPNPIVNGRRELLHKLYAEGSVKMDAPAVLTVPRSSIIQSGPEALVYVDHEGGAYAQTPVKIGRRGDQLVEVLSGVKTGDKVVTSGNLLIDGQAEMNRSFMPPTTEPMEDFLTPPQQQAIQNFIRVADAMAAAMAADDLTTFTKASETAMTTTASLTESLASIPSAKANLAPLNAARHFHGSTDLK